MIEVWEKIPDEELPQQPTESDENVASAALLALVGGDEEEEEGIPLNKFLCEIKKVQQ
jgi:hypothetical protein